ncbi:DUF1311 domain-containing protein [Pseudomonas entomophila]|jgi:uncharacterized protein YecT (DUF1311 family)|uniref:lysozyme inhibitor LprI family protein n=1 Tax=Pseudomonas entomophila TaxID=312306 RepID=UPI0015E36EA7|nr:lysozyme inhibitor LprI family protein [Pseudomonas entomophila]MBA1192332.1 DUF1311 domain-containing protein [Pseudomonas entomophila]
MKRMAGLALMGCLLSAHAAQDESTPCDTVENDQQAYACAAFNQQTAERELKAAFDDLLQRVNDQYPGAQAQALVHRLNAADALWRQVREADCEAETGSVQPGSQAHQAAWNNCMAQHSDDRSEYLQSILQP